MRSMLGRSLMVTLVLSLGALAAPPQDREAPNESSDTEHYVPPSARKSVEIANFYFRRKKYNAALSRYREAAVDDPTYAPAYLGLGRVYEKIGLKRKALEAYRKYLDALPSTKQAEDAREVHQAIDRLDRKANNHSPSPRGPSSGAGAPSEPR